MLLAACAFAPGHAHGGDAAGSDIFGLTTVHRIDLEMTADAYAAMQPERQQGPGFRGAPGEFPWARATVRIGGRSYENAGARYKGNFTYAASRNLLKRSLKIDLDRFGGSDRLGPLKTLVLNAGVLDPARSRETLAYAAYRDARVPAPRTAFAEVTLTVPGLHERVLLGLFTLVEDIDDVFLQAHFGASTGLLMKPEGVRGVEYLGEDWESYEGMYKPRREVSAGEARHLMDLAKLIEKAGDAEFHQRIGTFLDVDAFLRFLAVSAMIVHLDSPLAMPQNFLLHLPAADGRVVFLPWDMDLSFAAWPMGGPTEQQLNLSLLHPHVGEHRLIDRLLAEASIRERYLQIVRDFQATSFNEQALLARIDAVETAIRDPLAREAQAIAARGETRAAAQAAQVSSQAPSLRTFAIRRPAFITAQLANPQSGYVPRGMQGPPRFPSQLQSRLQRFGQLIEEQGGPDAIGARAAGRLRELGPLLQAGQFKEAEVLLDTVLKELERNTPPR